MKRINLPSPKRLLRVAIPPHTNVLIHLSDPEDRGRRGVTRAFLPMRSQLLSLAALVLVACLLSVFLDRDAPVAVAQSQHSVLVSPTSLTVPIGSRACYQLAPTTPPTHDLTFAETLGDTTKATVTKAALPAFHAYCVKGVATGSTTITHTVTSSDSNYNSITVPTVSVTVTAADTKPTIRFLHSKMSVVEGDSAEYRNFHDLNLREVTVKLDVAPRPTSFGSIMWWVPHPSCNQGFLACNGDPTRGEGAARYNFDFVASGLTARQVSYSPNSNNMEFKFLIVMDNEDEDRESVRIYLLPRRFVAGRGIVDNNAVCVGACSNPTREQRSMLIHIIDDDDGGGIGNATEGDLGRIPVPENLDQPSEEEDSENQEPQTPEEENEPEQEGEETPNRAPTVVHSPADIAIGNERGAHAVNLFSLVDDAPVSMFHDADGDALTIAAASSDKAVATVAVSQFTAMVSAKSRGTATITVTADDGRGGTVSDDFTVTVKSAPEVASGIADVSGLEAGTVKKVSLSGVFSDADGDALSITAGSFDDDVATVEVASGGSSLTVTGVSAGDTTITVIAQDTDGNQAADSFDVSVTASQPKLLTPPAQQQPNRAPTVASALSDVSGLAEGTTRDVSLSGVFSDADNDALTITASSDYEDVVIVTVASDFSELTLSGGSSGEATITVVAQDPDGAQATLTFDVEVTDSQVPQSQPQPAEQQPPAQQPEQQQEDTPTSEPETTATPESESEAETQEPEVSDIVDQYDANGDGAIDIAEYSQAANDYFDGKITYSEMERIALAYRAS